MKAIVNLQRRTNWFKAWLALTTCLLFLIPPSCEKYDPDQDSIPNMDEMVATPRAASSPTKMYWGPQDIDGPWAQEMCTGYYENFGNFILKVQNISEAGAKISTLEVRVANALIITAKGLSKDYFAAKTLKNLSNCAQLYVLIEGDQGCKVRVWVEATFKGLGTAYGKHLYYKSRQNKDWEDANNYCSDFNGHLVKISDAKENNFVWNFCNHQAGTGIGLSDIDQNQVWKWADGTLCRVVNWNYAQCPGGPSQGGGSECILITDYGYNNWRIGEPNNCGGQDANGNCIDESFAIFEDDGTWNDVPDFSNFIIEWDYIPNSIVIERLFRQEYPDYPYPW